MECVDAEYSSYDFSKVKDVMLISPKNCFSEDENGRGMMYPIVPDGEYDEGFASEVI
jgi:hypothetical protein